MAAHALPAGRSALAQVNKEKHELRGQLLALQGRPSEAAGEVSFLGQAHAEEMRALAAKSQALLSAAAAAAGREGDGSGDGGGQAEGREEKAGEGEGEGTGKEEGVGNEEKAGEGKGVGEGEDKKEV